MATYSKTILSGSTNGKAILVAETGTPGTLIHTAVAGTADLDEIWLYAVNSGIATVKVTMQWGETTAPNGNVEASILGESGLVLLIPGLLLQNELVVRAFAATANVICIHGFVNRITA